MRRFERKLGFVFFFFLLLLLLALIRILDLQVTRESEIARRIENNFDRVVPINIPLYRGSIQDANGKDLALSVPTLTVYAHPDTSRIRNKDTFVRELSKITGIPVRKIRKKIEAGSSRPVRIVTGVDRELKDRIKKLIIDTKNTSYIGIQEGYRRTYPNGSLAANLLGFVGIDGVGLEGMEYALNRFLGGGYSKALIYLNGGFGRIYLHPLKGMLGEERDVLLTIDTGAQNILEKIRDDIVRRWKPEKVSIILLDLSNGYILGIATYPYFDPNTFSMYKPEYRRNFAVTDLFEPGSIMKPFFIGYALDKGYVSPGLSVDTGRGRIKVYDRYVRDLRKLGRISLRDVIVYSSNVGAIKVASYLSKKDVDDLLKRFHMDRRFGIFPGEANPRIPDLNRKINILYSSIGQGIAMNTLNIAVAFGGLATGRILKPHIVKEVVSPEGKILYRAKVEVLGRDVFSDETLKWLRRTLTDVVERGTGRLSRSRFFTIAGKTGTSQKFDLKLGKYSKDKVVTYFAGFFPASEPRFVAVIVVDEPKGKALYGGVVCAPYFKKLAEQISFYFGLRPDKI